MILKSLRNVQIIEYFAISFLSLIIIIYERKRLFWSFLFLICFFRHFATPISVDYRICYEQSVRCQEEDHDDCRSMYLPRKAIIFDGESQYFP